MTSTAETGRKTWQAIATGALITAIVSGLVGAALTSYFSRARPSISLVSVGFQGPEGGDTIEVSDQLIGLTAKSLVTGTLNRFETFDKLRNTDTRVSEFIASFEQAIESVEAWRRQYTPPPQEGALRRLNPQAVEAHPFVIDDLVTSTINILLRQGKLGNPPVNLAVLTGVHPIVPFGKIDEESAWVLGLGVRNVSLSYKELSPDLRPDLELLARSFATGAFDNIDSYSAAFVEAANREIVLAKDISEGLRKLLLPNAFLAAKISIENRGGRAVTLGPYFAVRFLHEDVKPNFVILRAVSGDSVKRSMRVAQEGSTSSAPNDEIEGKRVQIKPFLPETGSYPYINVPPGGIREVLAVGVEPLKAATDDLVRIYGSKLLRCRVVGSTVKGDLVESEAASFSEKIGEEERKRLEERAQS